METRASRDRIATLVTGLSFGVVWAYVLYVVPGEPGARPRGGHPARRSLANIDTTSGRGYCDSLRQTKYASGHEVPEANRSGLLARNSASLNSGLSCGIEVR